MLGHGATDGPKDRHGFLPDRIPLAFVGPPNWIVSGMMDAVFTDRRGPTDTFLLLLFLSLDRFGAGSVVVCGAAAVCSRTHKSRVCTVVNKVKTRFTA